ncbi:MAG: NifU family protein [Candidatus Magnetoovum sp. WYHC-5]|nr:NifU family protein [Candidatus Magnetoovum sp. WYHC-5]
MDLSEVEKVVEKVRDGLKREGGDIEIISLRDNILYVKLTGSCDGCPMAGLTMKNWVERTILGELTNLKAVKAI